MSKISKIYIPPTKSYFVCTLYDINNFLKIPILVLIDLNEVEKVSNQTTRGFDIRIIADHYGIFEDLFGAAYFIPRVNLSIQV